MKTVIIQNSAHTHNTDLKKLKYINKYEKPIQAIHSMPFLPNITSIVCHTLRMYNVHLRPYEY